MTYIAVIMLVTFVIGVVETGREVIKEIPRDKRPFPWALLVAQISAIVLAVTVIAR